MGRQLCISDIHGCRKTFDALLDRVAFSKADELFILGDCIDRGPDSKGVIDRIWQLEKDGYRVRTILGNHELMALGYLDDERKDWKIQRGDRPFLESFGVHRSLEVPSEYFDWMDKLGAFCLEGRWILVHAGLNFKVADPLAPTLENLEEMLWIRDWHSLINRAWLGDRIIVHGHTPMRRAVIERNFEVMEEVGFIDIDAGCFVRNIDGLGHLCCLDLTTPAIFFEPNCE